MKKFKKQFVAFKMKSLEDNLSHTKFCAEHGIDKIHLSRYLMLGKSGSADKINAAIKIFLKEKPKDAINE